MPTASATLLIMFMSLLLAPSEALPAVEIPPGAEVSADGRWAVFKDDALGGFLREIDLVTGDSVVIPPADFQAPSPQDSFAISAHGEFVAYTATGKVDPITTFSVLLYRFDRVAGTSSLIEGGLKHATAITETLPDGSGFFFSRSYFGGFFADERGLYLFGSGFLMANVSAKPIDVHLAPGETVTIRASDLDNGSTTPESPQPPLHFSFHIYSDRLGPFESDILTLPLPDPTLRVDLVASDEHFKGSTVVDVTVTVGAPPIARAHDITVPTDIGSASATVLPAQVDAGSSDPDGDPLTLALLPSGPYRVGVNAVTLVVSDGTSTSSAPATITVVDRESPRLVSLERTPILLPTPGHDLVDVGLVFDARDNVRVIDVDISISQNEPVSEGPGDPSPDAVVIRDPAGHILGLKLRAERSDSGTGRIYLIRMVARDAAGNASVSNSVVVVPKGDALADLFDLIVRAVFVRLAGEGLPFDSEVMVAPAAAG